MKRYYRYVETIVHTSSGRVVCKNTVEFHAALRVEAGEADELSESCGDLSDEQLDALAADMKARGA